VSDDPGTRRQVPWGLGLLLAFFFLAGLVLPPLLTEDDAVRIAGLGVSLLALLALVAMVYAGVDERG
jgi:hypothetical protein